MKSYLKNILFSVIFFSLSCVVAGGSANAYSKRFWSWGGFKPPVSQSSMIEWTVFDDPIYFPPLMFYKTPAEYTILDSFLGRFVLLNLWASWCAPCVQELPSLNELQKSYSQDDLVVLPLMVEQEGFNNIASVYNNLKLDSLGMWVDLKGATKLIDGVAGLPTTILIDPFGDEIMRISGPVDWNSEEAKSMVNYYIDLWFNEENTSSRVKACEEQKVKSISPYKGECR